MKHFIEARRDAVAALQSTGIAGLAERVCLIVDLRGRCRVLIRPSGGADPEQVQGRIRALMTLAADIFWTDEVWVESAPQSPSEGALFEAAWKQARPEPRGQDKTFVIDRRFSKDAWLGAPLDPPWPQSEHTPPIVSFYSFKGGVGRTTAAIAVATNLARFGRRVVVIDLDLEAPGAGSLLQPSGGAPADLGVIDYLLERPLVGPGVIDIAEFYRFCDDRRIIGDGEPIAVVTSGALDGWYLEKLARINYEYLYRSAMETGAACSPLHDLLRSLRSAARPDVILLDSRGGLHDIGGLTVSGIAHLQVFFGLASQQSWEGLTLTISHLGKDLLLSGKRQRECMMVHAMVPPLGRPREDEIRAFRERSFQVFSENYYDEPDVPDAEWSIPDPESAESPHYPLVLTRDEKIAGYSSPSDIADSLCEGEYRALAKAILERVGRTL